MPGFRSTLATIWRLAHPYFYAEDRVAGRLLLAAVIAIELATIGINVPINQWNNAFYDAIQQYDWDAFIWQLEYFTMLAVSFVILKTYQQYLQQWLLIRWREWMTVRLWGAGSPMRITTACSSWATPPTIRISA